MLKDILFFVDNKNKEDDILTTSRDALLSDQEFHSVEGLLDDLKQ